MHFVIDGEKEKELFIQRNVFDIGMCRVKEMSPMIIMKFINNKFNFEEL